MMRPFETRSRITIKIMLSATFAIILSMEDASIFLKIFQKVPLKKCDRAASIFASFPP